MQPATLDDPDIVVLFDGESLGCVDYRLGRNIVGLEVNDRRQLAQLLGSHVHKLARSVMRRGAHLEKFIAQSLDVCLEPFDILSVIAAQVAFVCGDYLPALGKLGGILLELGVYRIKILDRVSPLGARNVDEMNEQTAAVYVPQKIVAETRTLGRTLDYAGDIGHDEGAAFVYIYDAEVGEQRREMIVCDLRVRLAYDRQQGRLAHIGEADQTYGGQKLELERDIVSLARKTGLCKTGDLPCGRCKMLVAPAALAAVRGDEGLAVGHVVHYAAGLGIAYERAARNGNAEAMTNLGYMYAHGHGMPVDGEKAVKWYTLASANGGYLAMGNLAYLYFTGIFVGKANPEKAVQLYEKVVEMEPQAECYMYDLGTCYENGMGTAVDMERAIALYREAARLGSGLAKKALKRLGVDRNVECGTGKAKGVAV